MALANLSGINPEGQPKLYITRISSGEIEEWKGKGGRGGGGGYDRGPREMFAATCSSCGNEARVPFRPTSGKPVYCSDCFRSMRGLGTISNTI